MRGAALPKGLPWQRPSPSPRNPAELGNDHRLVELAHSAFGGDQLDRGSGLERKGTKSQRSIDAIDAAEKGRPRSLRGGLTPHG
jgi:hypothetical protein